jgi:hypothetical protein
MKYLYKMYKKIALIVLISLSFSCKKSDMTGSDDTEKDKIKAARWMLGSWQYKSAEGLLVESWKKVNDSTYSGSSYFIKGKDTIHYETIDLNQLKDKLSYNTTIVGQNNNKAVSFNLTSVSEESLVFENSTRDYPQKISYTHVSKDSLATEISGYQSGKPSTEKYIMRRVK